MIKLVHVITGLKTGGAQFMLFNLLQRMDQSLFETQVISLTNGGPLSKKIQALGIPVRQLGMRSDFPNPFRLLQLAIWLRQSAPHLLQTWMYHADLIGGLASRMARSIPVVWAIHHSNLDPAMNKKRTVRIAKANAWFSHRIPTCIVCTSESSARIHAELGYAAEKMVIIPNAFDIARFKPDVNARMSVRQELGIPEESLIIGLAGRFNLLKDHQNFTQAAGKLHVHYPEVHFVLWGDGITWGNAKLAKWIQTAGICGCCHLLGLRQDTPRLTSALDILASSSCGESFPMVIGEAMSCAVPCVVTDVGDSARIVDDTGLVVPPRDRDALASALKKLVEVGSSQRRELGRRARQRVIDHFSLDHVVPRYEALYREIATRNEKRTVPH